MTQLDIATRRDRHNIILTVVGPINSYTYMEFQEKVYKAIAESDTAIEMDQVTALSSAGIGVLMTAMDDAEAAGHGFAIVAPAEIVRLALDSTGFGDRFPIVPSIRQI
jgi:anti-sigma B factor antagonist